MPGQRLIHQLMWKDVSPRTSPCEALKAHLADRFMDRLKKECIKDDDDFLLVQVAETHESLKSISSCVRPSF